jgi:hypothetical protein
MSREPLRWKRCEVTRAARAVQESGLHVRNIEISPDGVIRVNIGEPSKADDSAATDTANEWDSVK